MPIRDRVRALCLFSGGLDSQLAVCLLRDQRIDVTGVVFDSPFFATDTAVRAARSLDLPLRVERFTADIVALVQHPPHGLGRCLNPCVDCHARMLHRAGLMMRDEGYDFLATGEVLNERPFSQNRGSLGVVAATSGFEGRIVRPLSARLLEKTAPEREGIVDRARLLDIQGRGRRRQLDLAAHYGLRYFPSPAGGCLLTEPGFCRRLGDAMAHGGLQGERRLELLRCGRHFRLAPTVKLVVGRNEQDNIAIEQRAELPDLLLHLVDRAGPTGLLLDGAGESHVTQAAAICARYGGCPSGTTVPVHVRSSRDIKTLDVIPLPDAQCRDLLL